MYFHFQRKELCKLRDKLDLQKKALQETISNRKKFLSSLPSHLKALKKASLPVQNQLGVLHTKKLKQQQQSELLPPPLYLIYSQLFAQKEAFGEKIELEIMGSVKEAQTFARQLANKDSGNPSYILTIRAELLQVLSLVWSSAIVVYLESIPFLVPFKLMKNFLGKKVKVLLN